MIDLTPDPVLIGRTWHFPDGKMLPLVAGGSDLDMGGAPNAPFELPEPDFDRFGDDDGGGQDPAAPPSDPGGVSPAPSGDPGAAAPTSFATVEQAVAEIAKVRQEAAGYRVPLREYERDFGNMHPEDRQSIAGFVDAYRQGDNQRMLSWIIANGKVLAEQMGRPWAELAAGGGQGGAPAAPPQPDRVDLTDPAAFAKAVESVWAKHISEYDTNRQKAEARDRAADTILTGLDKRGYQVETAAGKHILFLIQTTPGPLDVDKAIDTYEEEMAGAAQSYLEKKRAIAAQSTTTTPGGAPPASKPDDEDDDLPPLKRAEKHMNRRLDNLSRARRAP